MILNGSSGEKETVGDLRVGETFSQELKHLCLACGETGSILAGGPPLSPRNGHPLVAKVLSHFGGDGVGAEGVEYLQ